MAEKMIRIQLADVKTFRLICKPCGRGVIEVPLDRLDDALLNGECRFCHHRFLSPNSPDSLHGLKIALEDLARIADKLGIEFDLPTPP